MLDELEPGQSRRAPMLVVMLDRAGWHCADDLAVPGNLTLVPLPPYSPELVWGFACQALMAAAPPVRLLGSMRPVGGRG